MSRKIPADEMLLAEAIAAARARGLSWCAGRAFLGGSDSRSPRGAVACCAVGALVLAKRTRLARNKQYSSDPKFSAVSCGNDLAMYWSGLVPDNGESLGWAFRCAMQDGDS